MRPVAGRRAAELYLLLRDTIAAARLTRRGYATGERLPFLGVDARLHAMRGDSVNADMLFRRFAGEYRVDPKHDRYRPILEWIRAGARR